MHADGRVRARRLTATPQQTHAGTHAYTQARSDCLLFSFLRPPHKLVIAFCFEDNFPSRNGGISAISFSLHPVHLSNFSPFRSISAAFSFVSFFVPPPSSSFPIIWRSACGHGSTDRWPETPLRYFSSLVTFLSPTPLPLSAPSLFPYHPAVWQAAPRWISYFYLRRASGRVL